MGLKKLQDAINKRLQGIQVDFSKYIRKNDEETAEEIHVNKTNHRVKLSTIASNILTEFRGPEKIIQDPVKCAKYRDFEWELFERLNDISLCNNARTFKVIYDSLKKQKKLNSEAQQANPEKVFADPFGGKEKIADTAMDYIQGKLAVIASPLYGVIDFSAFDRIPSDVLMDIAAHPNELEDTAEDLLFGNNLDNLHNEDELEETDLPAFISDMAKLQKINENLAAETAGEYINEYETAVWEAVNNAENTFKQEGLSEDEKADLKKTITTYRKSLIGCEIAKLQLNDARLHLLDDITAYADHKRIDDLAENITEEQITIVFQDTTSLQDLGTKVSEHIGLNVKRAEEVQVQPVEPQLPPHQLWYNSFKQQLKDMGYNNPMAMALIAVNNQIDTQETSQYDTTFANAQKYFDFVEKASQPAFIPVDETGKLALPRNNGNYVEWINNSSFPGLDFVSDEHIKYLYNMAKENRLFVKSDDALAAGYENSRYFHVNEDGSSYLSKPMSELIALSRLANEGDKVDCYTKEEFDKLHNYDEQLAGIENSQNLFIVSTIIDLENENDKALLEGKLISNLASKDACVHAHKRPEWFADQQMANKLFDAHKVLRKPEDRRTENDKKLAADYPVVGAEFDTIEKRLLKEIGLKSLNGLSRSMLIKSEDKQIITGKDTFEFALKVSDELLKGKAVFAGNKPLMFDGMYMNDAFLAEGYVQGLNIFSDSLNKYSKMLKNKSVGFEQFEAGIAELKNALAQSEYTCFGILQKANAVAFYSNEFISDMQKKALSGQQLSLDEIEGIKLAYQFRDYKDEIAQKGQDSKNLYKNYLATRLYNAICIESGNITALLDEKMRGEGIKTIKDSGKAAFGRTDDMSVDDLKSILAKSDVDLLKSNLINDLSKSIVGERGKLKVVDNQPVKLEFLSGSDVSASFNGNYAEDVIKANSLLIINGLFGSEEKFYDHLVNMPELTVRKCLGFYPSYQRTLKYKDVVNKLKEAFPGYKAPTDEKFKERAELTETFRRKYHEAHIKNLLTLKYAAKKINYTGSFQRYELWFADGDCSAEGLERNTELVRKLKQGTKQEKIDALKTVMDRMVDFDLTKYDLYDPQSILDNMDEFAHVINFGVEAQYVVSEAQKLGIDLSLPEYKDFVQRAEVIYDFGGAAYSFIEMYCSNAYAYFGDLNKPEILNFDENANMNDSDKTYGDFFNEDGSVFHRQDMSFSKFFVQAEFKRCLNSVFNDPSLTPEERLRKFNDMKIDVLHIKYVEGVAPELRKPEDKYLVSDDQAINDMFDKSAINAGSTYEVLNARFNPMLTSDMERLYKLVNGKLVQVYPCGVGQPPLVDTAQLTDELLYDIYKSDNYYIIKAGTNDALHIHDGIVDSKATAGLSFKTPRLPSENESEIHDLEAEYFNEIRVGQNFHDLYGKDFNNVGSDEYRSYIQKMTDNALKIDPDLAYPDSNKFSDADMQALTCLAYADPNVNGDYFAMGENPEVNAYSALGMGPNDLYILRAGNYKPGKHVHNAFVKSRIATKRELEAYNTGNPDPVAESIARSIYNIGMAAAANTGLTSKTYAESKSAEMTYDLLTKHKDLYELARSKAQSLGEEALNKFDAGFENCKRAAVMRQLYKKGIDAKYRLALYKDDKFVNPEGKNYKITDAEKKTLEKDVIIFDTLIHATNKQKNLHGNHPESNRIIDQAKQDMMTYPAEKMSDFLRSKSSYASWIIDKYHDSFIDALSDDAAMKIALEKGTNELEIRAYAEFEHFKNQLKAHPEMAKNTPEFINKMTSLRFAVDKIEAKEGLDVLAAVVHKNPDRALQFFSSITDPDFAQHCIGFLEAKDPNAATNPIIGYYNAKSASDKDLSYYGKDGSPAKYIKGLFMPKTDGSGMLMDFKSKEINKKYKDIQKEIDSIEIDIPAGLTETDVAMATMGLFFNPDIMLKSFNEVKNMAGSTMRSTGNNTVDIKLSLENFFENSLGNDDRENMHDSRKYVPGARRECQKLMEEYAKGNHKPFIDAVHRSFKACYDQIKTTTTYKDARFALCCQTLGNDILILQREGYQFTEEEIEVCNTMFAINNAVLESKKLERELLNEAVNHCYANQGKACEDPLYKEKFDRLLSLRVLQLDTRAGVATYRDAVTVTNDPEENEKRFTDRKLTVFEQGFNDLDKMAEAVFQTSIKDTEKYNELQNLTYYDMIQLRSTLTDNFAQGSDVASVDYKFKNAIDFISLINTKDEFNDTKYNHIKTEINQFIENYKEIRNNPSYKPEDLLALVDNAQRVRSVAHDYINSGLDKDNFIGSAYTVFVKLKADVLNRWIKEERECSNIIAKYEELNGIENIIFEEEPQPEPIADEELAKAETWFASFSEQLKDIGISYDNPLSLALVKEVNPDLDFHKEANVLTADEKKLSNLVKSVKLVDKKISMAFANDTLKNHTFYGDDYANHLCKNMMDPSKMSPDDKYRLYISAKNGNLVIANPSPNPGEEQNFRKVRVLTTGNARITLPMNFAPGEDLAANLSVEETRKLSALAAVIQRGKIDLGEIKTQLNEKYKKLENGKPVPRTKLEQEQFDGELDAYTNPVRWATQRHKLVSRAMQMNTIFKDEASRKKLSVLIKVNSIPETVRTAREQEIYDEDFLFRADNEQLFTTLMKKFNVKSVDQIPMNRLSDKDGRSFGAEVNYETLNKLAEAAFNAQPLMIDGQHVVYSNSNSMFVKAVNIDEYAKESSKLLKELNDTNSIFSSDSQAYTNFNNALKTMAESIQEFQQAKTASSQSIPTVLAEFDKAKVFCDQYIREHKELTELSTRQANRLGVMDKFLNLYERLSNNAYMPNNKVDRIAEDMAVEITKQFILNKEKTTVKKGQNILLDYKQLKTKTEAFKQNKIFKAMIAKGDEYVNRLYVMSPDKMIKEYEDTEMQLIRQEEALKRPKAPQKQNVPKKPGAVQKPEVNNNPEVKKKPEEIHLPG